MGEASAENDKTQQCLMGWWEWRRPGKPHWNVETAFMKEQRLVKCGAKEVWFRHLSLRHLGNIKGKCKIGFWTQNWGLEKKGKMQMFYYQQKSADCHSSDHGSKTMQQRKVVGKLNSAEGCVQEGREGTEGFSRTQKNPWNYSILEAKEKLEEERKNKILITVPKY